MSSLPDAECQETPLRRDAIENRERILRAARELLDEKGLDFALEAVARRADVGIGTLYRRFRNRNELLDELFERSVERFGQLYRDAVACEDPWEGLVQYFERSVELMVSERGIWLLAFRGSTRERDLIAVRNLGETYLPQLIRRAKKAGVIRPDVQFGDVVILSGMIRQGLDMTEPEVPGTVQRYLAIVLDGLRTVGPDRTPFRARALTRNEIDRAVRRRLNV